MAEKIYWLSRHKLTAEQEQALREIHGADVEIEHEDTTFQDVYDLAETIALHDDGFVYAVAGAHHLLACCDVDRGNLLEFGVFANEPKRRADGTFGLDAVYHWEQGALVQVWPQQRVLGTVAGGAVMLEYCIGIVVGLVIGLALAHACR